MSLLDLPGWNLLSRETEDRTLILNAEYTEPPRCCPHCGIVNEPGKLYRWSAKEQDFRDTPMHGKQCLLRVNRQRWRCRECHRTFMQPLAGLDEDHRMTERLADYIREQAMDRTYAALAVELGLDEKTIRNIFNAYADELRAQFKTETPLWLGIDELHVIGKPRAIFTNVQERTIVDMLEKRDKKTIVDYLYKMPDRQRVELVTIDMWTPYKEAAQICLPQAKIIIDKYHVARMASDALEAVRKATHKDLTAAQRRQLKHDRFVLLKRKRNLTDSQFLKLESWTGSFPQLLAAYEAKEAFYELFDADLTPAGAKRRYAAWLAGLDPETKEAFGDLIRALKNWEPEVFAYFAHRVTNAFTEASNGIARVINRMGRGYSFEALRIKLLYRSPRKVRGKKADRVAEAPRLLYDPACGSAGLLADLGVDLDGLQAKLNLVFNTEPETPNVTVSTQKSG